MPGRRTRPQRHRGPAGGALPVNKGAGSQELPATAGVYCCKRCGHAWVPRNKDEEPRVCPKCKSLYWDRPRKDTGKEPEGTDGAEKAATPGKGPAGKASQRKTEP